MSDDTPKGLLFATAKQTERHDAFIEAFVARQKKVLEESPKDTLPVVAYAVEWANDGQQQGIALFEKKENAVRWYETMGGQPMNLICQSDALAAIAKLKSELEDAGRHALQVYTDNKTALSAKEAEIARWQEQVAGQAVVNQWRLEEIERLTAERDQFYMDYRIKCDEDTKAANLRINELTAERDALKAALTELVSVKDLKESTEAIWFAGPLSSAGENWESVCAANKRQYIERQPKAWDEARAAIAARSGE